MWGKKPGKGHAGGQQGGSGPGPLSGRRGWDFYHHLSGGRRRYSSRYFLLPWGSREVLRLLRCDTTLQTELGRPFHTAPVLLSPAWQAVMLKVWHRKRAAQAETEACRGREPVWLTGLRCSLRFSFHISKSMSTFNSFSCETSRQLVSHRPPQAG